MTAPDRHCRWGILGTAQIARKNWAAIRRSGNGRLVAVASRSVERSQSFIAACQAEVPCDPAPQAVGSYQELLQRDDVDAVYIPLPTGIRGEWVIRAAEAGKHVLVEKPVGVNSAEVARMLDACRRRNVQFMDGVMFMHSRRLEQMRRVLDDGTSVGTLRRIASQFSFRGSPEFLQQNIRVSSALEPLGCLGDLGWYNIRLTLWAVRYQMPLKVVAHLLAEARRPDCAASVPLEFSAEFFFPHGVSATFFCSFQAENQQWAVLSGDRGFLHVPDFVLPFYGCETAFSVTNAVFHQDGCRFHMEDHTRRHAVAEYSDGHASAQETQLFRSFSALVLSGRVDPHWGEIALKTQQVLDACLTSAREEGRPVAVTA
uniref:Gfo/Idh/MocA family oxidoreductase n=1 Tax=Schlesneria paludicola TaxID=360056 RepID=A0A7C4QML6_9PLAN